MDNTRQSFKDKWEKNVDLAFLQTLDDKSEIHKWILKRNGFTSIIELRKYLSNKRRILDAGCGNGRVTALLRINSSESFSEVYAIDLVSAEIAKNNFTKYSINNVTVLKKDLLGNLTDLGKFDYIYCQEVLHHTENPRKAFLNLCSILSDNGEIAIYVYKKKAPVREYVDDFIRDHIAIMDYENALCVCDQITKLGEALSKLKITIEIPDVDVLEIKKGSYDLQRFIYHFFMKCFWNDELSFKENSAINYDWYHPQLCSRHTIEEIRLWFREANLTVNHEYVDFYGITMRGKK